MEKQESRVKGFVFSRGSDSKVTIEEEEDSYDKATKNKSLILRHQYCREIISSLYGQNPQIPLPRQIIEYDNWEKARDNPTLETTTLVLVIGGITSHPLNLGKAILIYLEGLLRHSIKCGRLLGKKGIIDYLINNGRLGDDGSIKIEDITITQTLLAKKEKQN